MMNMISALGPFGRILFRTLVLFRSISAAVEIGILAPKTAQNSRGDVFVSLWASPGSTCRSWRFEVRVESAAAEWRQWTVPTNKEGDLCAGDFVLNGLEAGEHEMQIELHDDSLLEDSFLSERWAKIEINKRATAGTQDQMFYGSAPHLPQTRVQPSSQTESVKCKDSADASDEMAWNTTLVTGFWSPKNFAKTKRTETEYWPWIENLMHVLAPIVIHVDPELIHIFEGLRREVDAPTLIVPWPLGEIWADRAAKRARLFEMALRDVQASRYAPEYSLIMHEKLSLLDRVAGENPFSSTHFLWVDAGIDRAGFLKGKRWPASLPPAVEHQDSFLAADIFGLVSRYHAEVRRQWQRVAQGSPLRALASVVDHRAVGLAGTQFGGSQRAVAGVATAYYRVLDRCLELGEQCLTDQIVLSAVACQHPELFHLVVPRWEGPGELWFALLHRLASPYPGRSLGFESPAPGSVMTLQRRQGGESEPSSDEEQQHESERENEQQSGGDAESATDSPPPSPPPPPGTTGAWFAAVRFSSSALNVAREQGSVEELAVLIDGTRVGHCLLQEPLEEAGECGFFAHKCRWQASAVEGRLDWTGAPLLLEPARCQHELLLRIPPPGGWVTVSLELWVSGQVGLVEYAETSFFAVRAPSLAPLSASLLDSAGAHLAQDPAKLARWSVPNPPLAHATALRAFMAAYRLRGGGSVQGSAAGVDGMAARAKLLSQGWVAIELEGAAGECRDLLVQPRPAGQGHHVLVFKAWSAGSGAEQFVALHVSFFAAETLAGRHAMRGFAVLANHTLRSHPNLLPVRAACLDRHGSAFWTLHRPHMSIQTQTAVVGVTAWLAPARYRSWSAMLEEEQARVSPQRFLSGARVAGLAGLGLQLVEGARSLAAADVLHGDLKASNVMVERRAGGQPRVVVADLHLAERVRFDGDGAYEPEEAAARIMCSEGKECAADVMQAGVSVHCAPECFSCEGFTREVEVWSVGLMLLQLFQLVQGGPITGIDVPLPPAETFLNSADDADALALLGVQLVPEATRHAWRARELLSLVRCALDRDAWRRCRYAELAERLAAIAAPRPAIAALPPSARASTPHAGPELDGVDADAVLEAELPRLLVCGVAAPLVVRVAPVRGARGVVEASLSLASSGQGLWSAPVRLWQGVGSVLVRLPEFRAADSHDSAGAPLETLLCLELKGGSASADAAVYRKCTVSAVSARSAFPSVLHRERRVREDVVVWGPDQVLAIETSVQVPRDGTLLVLPGTVLLLAPGVDLEVSGMLVCLGEKEQPVVFTAATPEGWGGLVISGSVRLTHTWLTQGGANTQRTFGHSSSQAVLMVHPGGALHAVRGGVLHSIGKAVGVLEAEAALLSALISHCDLGVEGVKAGVTMVDCDLSAFPDDDGEQADDDNDAIRLTNQAFNGATAIVAHSRLSMGEDDGVDHDHAFLIVEQTYIYGFSNEGLALSGNNPDTGLHGEVSIVNVIVEHCGQGIELGYGGPRVSISSALLRHNGVGLRYGDEYPWGHTGVMRASRVLVLDSTTAGFLNEFPEHPHTRPENVAVECSMTGVAEVDGGDADVEALWWCGECPGCAHGSTSECNTSAGVFCEALARYMAERAGVSIVVKDQGGGSSLCDAQHHDPLSLQVQIDGLSEHETYALAISLNGVRCHERLLAAETAGRITEAVGISAPGLWNREGANMVSAALAVPRLQTTVAAREERLERRHLACVLPRYLSAAALRASMALGVRHSQPEAVQVHAASLNAPSDVLRPLPDAVWCGARMIAKAQLELPAAGNGPGSDATAEGVVIVKAVGGAEAHYDSELHSREVLAYCLDSALQTAVVAPVFEQAWSERDVASLCRRQLEGRDASCQSTMLINTQCNSVRANASESLSPPHFFGTVALFHPDPILHIPEELWLRLARQQGRWHSALERQLAMVADPPPAHSNLLAYVLFNFVGNCMRSAHNHHLGREGLGHVWLAIDNDRCFVHSDVSGAASVPDAHRLRAAQWQSMAMSHCEWPEHLARHILALLARGETVSASVRACASRLRPSGAAAFSNWTELALLEADSRLRSFAAHLKHCGRT